MTSRPGFATALAAAALALAPVAVLTALPAPARAQYGGVANCTAASPYATGAGVAYDMGTACNRAMYECRVRTPYGYYCYITNRWWS